MTVDLLLIAPTFRLQAVGVQTPHLLRAEVLRDDREGRRVGPS